VVAVAGQKNWSGAIVEGAIFDQWHLLVGAEVAAHVRPEAYLGGSRELVVVADSPAWATQIKLLQRPLLARINEHFGSKKVLKLVVKSQIGGQRRVFRRSSRHP
jgi:predicted nucleic acid-binding Zn ribbon protein